jgi:hypothetical protein
MRAVLKKEMELDRFVFQCELDLGPREFHFFRCTHMENTQKSAMTSIGRP